MRNLSNTVRTLAVALLLVVVAFGVYFLLYIQQRENLLIKYHLRLLLSASDYASDAIQGLALNVQNVVTADAASLGSKEIPAQVDSAIHQKFRLISAIEEDNSPSPGVQSFASLLDSLENAEAPPQKNGKPGRTDQKTKKRAGETYPVSFTSYTATDTVDVRVGIVLDTPTTDPYLTFVFTRADVANGKVQTWRVSLDELLKNTLPNEFFSSVMLVRSNGDVLLRDNESHLQFGKFQLPLRSGGEPDSSTSPSKTPSSRVIDARIAGETYKVFMQPLRVPIAMYCRERRGSRDWRLEERWYVVGLLPASRFRTMSMAIPPSVALLTIGVIALALCCFPLLKVRFMGPRDELTFRDLAQLSFTMVVGASLATFGVFYFLLHEQEADRTEAGLDSLSTRISYQFGRELNELDTTLVWMTRARLHEQKDAGRLLQDDSTHAPVMEMAYWMNSEGKQTSKWTIRTFTTPNIKVSTRSYFSEASKGLLWPSPPTDPLFREGRYVASIRSITTGNVSAVLSRLYAKPGTDAPNTVAAIEAHLRSVISPVLPPGTGFAIVDPEGLVQFHSESVRNMRENFLNELGDPDGVEDAIQRREYTRVRTTYRTVESVIKVSPIENTPWSLVVFENGGGSHVRLIETLATSLTIFGVYLALLVFVWCWVFFWKKTLRRPGERRRMWYWPSRKNKKHVAYARLILIFYSFLLIWTIVLATSNAVVILGTVLLLPPVSLMALRLYLHGKTQRRGKREAWIPFPSLFVRGVASSWARLCSSRWARVLAWRWMKLTRSKLARSITPGRPLMAYRYMLVLLITLIGIFPAASIFLLVRSEVSLLSLEERQVDYLASMKKSRLESLDWYRDVPLSPASFNSLLRRVRGGPTDTEIGFYVPIGWKWWWMGFSGARRGMPDPKHGTSSASQQKDASSTSPQKADSSQTAFEVPSFIITGFLNRICTRFGVMAAITEPLEVPSDTSCHWCLHDDTLAFARRDPVHAGMLGDRMIDSDSADYIRLQTHLQRSGWRDLFRLLLLSVLAYWVLFNFVKVSVRQVFLGGFRLPRPPKSPADIPKDPRAILVRRPLDSTQKDKMHVVSVQAVREAPSASWLIDAFKRSHKASVVLEGLLYLLKDRQTTMRTLEFLEELSATKPAPEQVLIESSVEPLHFLVARYEEHYAERDKLGISIERWSAALQDFTLRRTSREPWKAPATLSPEMQRVVSTEASPTRVLNAIGAELSKDANFAKLSPAQVVVAFLDQAQAHYRRLWKSCSTIEKLLLYRIAKEGLVSRSASSVLTSLVRRGLVRPPCRLMNESFRRFVLTAERPEVIATWEQRGGPSTWSKMKLPLGFALGGLTILFFATQREALNQTVGLLAALATFAPALVSAVGDLRGIRLGSNSKPG